MPIDKSHIGIKNRQNPKKRGYHFKQGHFEDRFKPQKYYGEYPIIYRSELEFKYMVSLERNPNVVKWSSEKIVIPYFMDEKIDGKVVTKKHDYFTDFTVHMKSGNVYVVEVKPYAQCPRFKNQILNDPVIYKNACKWKAAIDWCKKNGMIFKVITEKEINH